MAMQIKITGVAVDGLDIPERVFTEGIDFEIGSMLQEGEQAFREEMVAIIPAGNNSTVFREYAQRIGAQEVFLSLDTDATGTFSPRVPSEPTNLERLDVEDDAIELDFEESEDAEEYEVIVTTSPTPPAEDAVGMPIVPPAPPTIPAVPGGFASSSRTYNSISYTWDATVGATGYDIYVTTSATAPTAETAATASVANIRAYTAVQLDDNTTYRAYLRAKNSAGASAWTAAVVVTTPIEPTVPAVPTGFASTSSTHEQIVYGWTAVVDATGYDFYITTDSAVPDDDTLPTVTAGALTTLTRTGLTGSTTYYAYLRARNDAGVSDWTGAVTVTTAVTPVQVPPVPANFARASSTQNSISYRWAAADRAVSYDLYITTSATAPTAQTAATVTGLTGTTYTRTGLSGNTQYRSYIRGVNAGGNGAWSAVLTVTTLATPVTAPPRVENFQLTGTTLNSLTFSWDAAPGATGYDLFLSRATETTPGSGIFQFTTPTLQTIPTVADITTTTYTRTGLTANTSYGVYVRAKNSAGTGVWTLRLLSTTAAPPTAPATPANFASSSKSATQITYSWTASANADGYDLYLTDGVLREVPTAETTPTVSVGAVTTHTVTSLTGNTEYWAYIRAKNRGVLSNWSGLLRVTTDNSTDTPPVAVDNFLLVSSSSNSVNLSWTASAGATGYDLYFTTSATAPTAQTAPRVTLGNVTTYTQSGLTPSTRYAIYIRAKNAGGNSAWSSPALYAGTSAAGAPASPTALTTSATRTAVTVNWTAATGATGYDIFLGTSGTAPQESTVPTASVAGVTTYTTTYSSRVGTTANYGISVRAKNGNGTSGWVTVQGYYPPAVPTNFRSPSRIATQIVYMWTASTDATGYDIYVTTSATAPTASTVPTASVGRVTTYTRTGLTGNTQYRAYIRAKNNTGIGDWSGAITVRTQLNPPPRPANLRFDQEGTARGGGRIHRYGTVRWDASTGATSYDLFRSRTVSNPVGNTGWFNQTDNFYGTWFQYTDETWYWHVRAVSSGGKSGWTSLTIPATE